MKIKMNGEIIFILIGTLGLLIGLHGTFSESLPLAMLPANAAGLTKFGVIQEMDGKASRKHVNDVLWYSLKENKKLYVGDSLQTKKESSVHIEVQQKVKLSIKVGPETFVRMRLNQNKPLLHILDGEIDLSAESSDNVFVTNGLQIKNIELKKNSLTKVRRSKDGSLDVRTQRTDIENEQAAPEIGQSKEIWINSKKAESLGNIPVARPLKFPYPADQTVFLYQKAGQIFLFPDDACQIKCSLRVLKNGNEEIMNVFFEPAQEVVVSIPFNMETRAVYTWYFENSDKKTNGVFQILPFSGAEMKKYLKLRTPIEIISGL